MHIDPDGSNIIFAGEEGADQIVEGADREQHRAKDHGGLRYPDRPGVLPLTDVMKAIAFIGQLECVTGKQHRQEAGDQPAPDLSDQMIAPQIFEEQVHPDMAAAIQSIGEREKGSCRHAVASKVRCSGYDCPGPARHHLQGDKAEDHDQKDCRQIASPSVGRVQDATHHFQKRHDGPPFFQRPGDVSSPGHETVEGLFRGLVGFDEGFACIASRFNPFSGHGLADLAQLFLKDVACGAGGHAVFCEFIDGEFIILD